MMLEHQKKESYLAILREELVPATGCTEPIALAYCAAKARQLLGQLPEQALIEVSGNIIKNAKSVVVPNCDGMRGIYAAVAAGIVAGDADAQLQVLGNVSTQQRIEIEQYLAKTPMDIVDMVSENKLDMRITVRSKSHSAVVRIANNHCNIVYMAHDGYVLLEQAVGRSSEEHLTDKSILNIHDILDFAGTVEIDDVRAMLDRQINCNLAIAQEGIKNSWGANIGSVLLKEHPQDISRQICAWAAAGSDARMSGCELPVIILSGSGNQGITASVPVIRYAQYLEASQEQLYRALLVSNLVTIEQKAKIGRLSAYCGAVCAGVGAGAGIAYLCSETEEAVTSTVQNAVTVLSGVICDGAKPSCAAKIAQSVSAGLLGYEMYLNGQCFHSGDGIVASDAEQTMENIGVLATEGMKVTDETILRIMTTSCSQEQCK